VPDPRAARPRRPGRLTTLVTALLAAVMVASGCSVIPAGNGPQAASVPGPPAGGGPCCGLLVRPPQAGWNAPEVVKNFLLASAIVAHNYRVAREYLTGAAIRSWHPSAGVIILAREPTLSYQGGRGITGPGGKQSVLVTGQELARLSSTGQYIPAPGGAQAPTEAFTLREINGILKIDGLSSSGKPSRELLLTNYLFRLVYAPRNLYYLGGRNGQLLPYPVYVPIQGTVPAAALVRDLINGPSGWLQGAARTAFPSRSHLAGPVRVFPGPSGGRTALVSIAVPPHSVGLNERAIALQVAATLTSSVYSAPLFRAVKIEINGHLWPPQRLGQALGQSFYQKFIPHLPGARAYYLSQDGALRSLAAGSGHATAAVRASGTGQVALSKIAVSPRNNQLAGLTGQANMVYTGTLATSGDSGRRTLGQLHSQLTGNSFTSMSWDSLGDLWVAGTIRHKPGIWVLRDGRAPAIQVPLPPGADQVIAFRVAPDGNRVAMIVRTGTSVQLQLAAIRHDNSNGFWLTTTTQLGPSLPALSALTWFGEDNLLVVAGSGGSSQLWEVPVDGDNPTPLPKQPGILTVTAAGPGYPLYLGLAGNRLETMAGPNRPLNDITPGQAIIYPG
jgi:Lipoprotein LpqB beta-propeller domain